jgi:hypothetical protein
VKSNAAAIQSSGRRGILVSRLFVLLLMLFSPEQTQSAQAVVKMVLPNGWKNFRAWQAKAIRLPRTFSLDHPERELRKLLFHILKMELGKIEIHCSAIFGSELLCH